MRYSVGEIGARLGATVLGDASAEVTGVAIDSRAVRPGDLFVALPGARVNGHGFLDQAQTNGAAAALVARSCPVELPQVVVADTLAALGALATHVRATGAFKLAAVTGSIAKTTTKEFLAAFVSTTFATGITHGNRNSESGFPVELCNLAAGVTWMVAELGMSHAGELDRLGKIASPDLVLYTVIAPVHLEFFVNIEAIAKAKAELIPHLRPGGTLVLNAADPRVAAFARRFAGRVLRYGVPHETDLWIDDYESRGLLGSRLAFRGSGFDLAIELPLAGRHQADNLLAAATAALAIGVPPSAIEQAASRQAPAPHRGEVHRLASDITLVDDSYNASPAAMARMLELLAASPGRRIAVLGEMLELGATAPELHREVGRQAAAAADVVVAVGGAAAAELAHAADNGKARHVADADAALAQLRTLLQPGDVVLIKGSRGIALDRVVDGLREAAQ